MADKGFKRKLAAILSADVIGYSRLMRDDEEATVRDIAAHRVLISDIVQHHQGRVVDSPGDNILAEFASVVDAVNGAINIQKEIKRSNEDTSQERQMEFRIGINLGDVIEEEERIYGDGVNIAARVEGLASAGGIAISGTVYEHIKEKLSLGYHSLGEQDVKNISEPVRVYRLLTEPDDAGKMIGEERPKSRKLLNVAYSALALIILVVAAFIIWNNYFRVQIEPASVERMAYPLPDKASIAILPFVNMSDDQQQEYFSDGITESIIMALSKVRGMFVIARNSTFAYKGKAVKIQQVAEELGVRYVLEGSVQKTEDRVRITTQLIDAVSGNHMWAERYDRSLKDLFVLQDEITMEIITALQVQLTEGEELNVEGVGTDNLDAYLKLMQAREQQRRWNKEGNALCRKLTEEAIALDPGYADAYLTLSAVHLVDMMIGTSESLEKSLERAEEMVQKAITLRGPYADALAFLGRIYLTKRQYAKAISEGERAVAMAPNSAFVHAALAFTNKYAGKPDEAIALFKKAIRLSPIPDTWYLTTLGSCYEMVGRYEEAISAYKRGLRLSPEDVLSHIGLAATYSLMGRDVDARAEAAEVLRIDPKFTLESFSKGRLYKNPEDLEREIEALRKAGLPEHPPLPIPDKPSIAVLAFDNLSGDPEQEYFSDGIAENIITALSKVGELFVIARNSSFTYKGKPVKVQLVGRELGVRYVLEGSVQKFGDRVRVTAQLIDAKNGRHKWAERYDREMKDIFAIQDDITKRVVSSLQANLTVGEITHAYAKGTNSLEAYLKVIKARNIHMRFTKDDNLISRDLAQEAISIDPEYGEAYVLLAATYMAETYFESDKSPKESMGQAIGYAKKAVELETVGGHAMLGQLYSLIGQIDKALTECKLAVDLAPNSAIARTWYGAVLINAGQYDMAVEKLEQAGRRDPMAGTWFLRYLGSAYSFKGRHDEAISTLKKAIQKAPNDYLSRLLLTRAYIFAGRPDEAQAEAAEVVRLNPNFSLEQFAKRYNAKDKDRSMDAFRQAGLK